MSSSTIKSVQLGRGGPEVSALGFGAMGMSAFYGTPPSDEENMKVLKTCVDAWCTFWDTSDMYGEVMGVNEKLLGKFFKSHPGTREKVFLCTKFGVYHEENFSNMQVRGSREYVLEACDKSLKNLGIDCIDLYYQHRIDRTRPIEETIGAMKELKEAGKIKHLGLSEATPDEIRRAYKVCPISAVQIEFSPWTPDILTNGIAETCKELGIAIVAYSPLGRGFLTGAYKSNDDIPDDDYRKNNPRFSKEHFAANLAIVDELQKLASSKNATAGQLTLAWIMSHGFIPIPGTKKEKYLQENVGAAKVDLSREDIEKINDVVKKATVGGGRYDEKLQGMNAF